MQIFPKNIITKSYHSKTLKVVTKSYHQKTLKVVRNPKTCNFRITDPMTIDIWTNLDGIYTKFAPFVVQKILSNHILFLFLGNCCHNQTEKKTQRDLNFIFMKFQNMLTFLSSNVSFAKKAVSEHQFRENEVTCECCSSKTLGKFTLVAII